MDDCTCWSFSLPCLNADPDPFSSYFSWNSIHRSSCWSSSLFAICRSIHFQTWLAWKLDFHLNFSKLLILLYPYSSGTCMLSRNLSSCKLEAHLYVFQSCDPIASYHHLLCGSTPDSLDTFSICLLSRLPPSLDPYGSSPSRCDHPILAPLRRPATHGPFSQGFQCTDPAACSNCVASSSHLESLRWSSDTKALRPQGFWGLCSIDFEQTIQWSAVQVHPSEFAIDSR